MCIKETKKGFTLIELLVVVLIIGILAAIALPMYQRSVAASRATEVLTVYSSIRSAMDRYFLTNGTHTYRISDLDIDIPSSSNFTVYEGNLGQIFQVWNNTISLELWRGPSAWSKWAGQEYCSFRKDSKLGMRTCMAIGYDGCCIFDYGTGHPFNPKGVCLLPGRGKFYKCETP